MCRHKRDCTKPLVLCHSYMFEDAYIQYCSATLIFIRFQNIILLERDKNRRSCFIFYANLSYWKIKWKQLADHSASKSRMWFLWDYSYIETKSVGGYLRNICVKTMRWYYASKYEKFTSYKPYNWFTGSYLKSTLTTSRNIHRTLKSEITLDKKHGRR